MVFRVRIEMRDKVITYSRKEGKNDRIAGTNQRTERKNIKP